MLVDEKIGLKSGLRSVVLVGILVVSAEVGTEGTKMIVVGTTKSVTAKFGTMELTCGEVLVGIPVRLVW